MQVQPDLRAHQSRFAVAGVELQDFAEHTLGLCKFMLVLEQSRPPDCDLRIVDITRALQDLLGVTVVALVATARAGIHQRIDLANQRTGIVPVDHALCAQLLEFQYDLRRIGGPVDADRSFGIRTEDCGRQQRQGEKASHVTHCSNTSNAAGLSSASCVKVKPLSVGSSAFSSRANQSFAVVGKRNEHAVDGHADDLLRRQSARIGRTNRDRRIAEYLRGRRDLQRAVCAAAAEHDALRGDDRGVGRSSGHSHAVRT